MKTKIFLRNAFAMALLALLFACNTDELENKISDLEQQKLTDSSQIVKKDALILQFVGSMNEIEDNLAQIKQRENIMATNFKQVDIEFNQSMKDKIIEDIDLINRLLQDNKDKMLAMNDKLKKSNIKISQLQKMMESIANRMQEKDAEISRLKKQLSEANQQIKVLFEEYNNRLEELGDQEDKLNTAFYCYGTSKELKAEGIITKEGGFIGIGKTEKLAKNFNKSYFTKVDISLVNEIELMSKKAKIITNHPTTSYKIERKDGVVEKLIITNSEAFWATSKYLVIVVD